MTRDEAIKIIEPFIPSLQRNYLRWGEETDKSKDRSWLYRDEWYGRPSAAWNDPDRERSMPEVIPENFLESLAVEIDGKKYVVKRSYPERNYRRVYLQITDFAYYGNTHKYGKLQIDGVCWSYEDGGGHISQRKLDDTEPRVRNIWDVNLFRIVGEGEMSASECPIGESTARFVSLEELVATAAYVTLLRIGGPFVLDNASSYATVRRKEDILVTADADGNVMWGEKIKRILKINEM